MPRISLGDIVFQEADIGKYISTSQYRVVNNVILGVDVKIIGHYNNCITINVNCKRASFLGSYGITTNVGYVIRAIVELLDLSEDDGIKLSDIRNIPIRLIYDGPDIYDSRCVGMGHFMDNRFVLFEDLVRCGADSEAVSVNVCETK